MVSIELKPSSNDELDTDSDGKVNTLLQPRPEKARFNSRRARDGHAEDATPSTSINGAVSDNSRPQMKRKDSESLSTSNKRVRHVQAAQDDVMGLDMNEHAKDEKNLNSKTEPVQRTMDRLGGRLPQSLGNNLASPSTSTNAKPNLSRNKFSMKPLLFLSNSAVTKSRRSATHDLLSKLARPPSDVYKRVESKTVLASTSGLSMAVDKGKAPLKRRQVLSAPQTTRHASKTKPIPPDAEVIEISDDDDLPTPLISGENVATSPGSRLSESVQERVTRPNMRRGQLRHISSSGGDSFECSDRYGDEMNVVRPPLSGSQVDVTQLELLQRQVLCRVFGASSRVTTDEVPNLPQLIPSVPGIKSVDSIRSDSDDLFRIPSRASSPEMQVTDDTNENQVSRGLISLPSSSSSSIGLSPKDNYLSPPAPTTTGASLTKLSLSQQPSMPTRRSSHRSSHSSASEGLSTFFDNDLVPIIRTSTPEDQEPSASSSPPGSPKTYGGFRTLTWKDFREDLNNFTPRCYYAKDLPHALQDYINSISEFTHMLDGMRNLFKATILENTVEDEPDAPPIEISNDVDTQATPPWEFYYTNRMWLGEGVPPPDIKNLVSCTCKGGCNPKSKTCACLMRQREATGDPQLEFAYDKNGRLKTPGYPIFECNDLCGCSDECRNRVVQHGRKVSVSISKTKSKGWGVFAGAKKIPVGTFIGIYSGELLMDAVAHERGVNYNKFGRTYLFDIDFHHLKDGKGWVNMFTVDAYHAGNFTRFLNHSCDPNCRMYACYINEGDIQKPLLAIFSRKDIEPYEEICFNYQGTYPNDDEDDGDSDNDDDKALDPNHGKESVYVPCRCGAKNCTGTMFK